MDAHLTGMGPSSTAVSHTAAGVASVVLLFCLAASAGSWAPTITPGFGSSAVSMESLPPNYAYMPIHYR